MLEDFDFNALETEMHTDSAGKRVRDIAAEMWADEKTRLERDFLVGASDVLEDILGVSNGTDPIVNVPNLSGAGTVEVTIDGMRFRVSFSINADTEPTLSVRLYSSSSQPSWTGIESLTELGSRLASGAVRPDDED